jgi:hypothetical protein
MIQGLKEAHIEVSFKKSMLRDESLRDESFAIFRVW